MATTTHNPRKVLIEVSEADYERLEAARDGRARDTWSRLSQPVTLATTCVVLWDRDAQWAVDEYRDQHKHDV